MTLALHFLSPSTVDPGMPVQVGDAFWIPLMMPLAGHTLVVDGGLTIDGAWY